MSWRDYYRLAEKYHGDLERATADELQAAAEANPNTPGAARDLAEREYWRVKLERWNSAAQDEQSYPLAICPFSVYEPETHDPETCVYCCALESGGDISAWLGIDAEREAYNETN